MRRTTDFVRPAIESASVRRRQRPCRRRGESPLAACRGHAADPLSHLGPAADLWRSASIPRLTIETRRSKVRRHRPTRGATGKPASRALKPCAKLRIVRHFLRKLPGLVFSARVVVRRGGVEPCVGTHPGVPCDLAAPVLAICRSRRSGGNAEDRTVLDFRAAARASSAVETCRAVSGYGAARSQARCSDSTSCR